MKRSRVAKRYAQALFETAKDQNALEQVQEDVATLQKEYEEVEEFKHLIDSPVISNEVKLKTFSSLFQERLHPITFRFITLLINKNREGLLPAVATHFHELLDEYQGVVRGVVETVLPLSDEQLNKLQAQLHTRIGKDVLLSQRVDKNLLGGLRVVVQDLVFDASLRQQLNKIKLRISES